MTLTVSSLFTLVIVLLVLGILVWLAFYVLDNFGPPEPVNRMIRVVIVVVAVLILVAMLLSLAGVGPGIKLSTALLAPLVTA